MITSLTSAFSSEAKRPDLEVPLILILEIVCPFPLNLPPKGTSVPPMGANEESSDISISDSTTKLALLSSEIFSPIYARSYALETI